MPMMNSEARKRAADAAGRAADQAGVHRLADAWDQEAALEEASGNGFAAVILHAHARELRAVLDRPPLSA
ncbi:hypothetical protein ACIRN4_16220 [Pimelobacter simplex]|uniref:Uncharacterized protein n=3 Tax=Nocardioides simplex TaxID=2045 RepID=A0A0A1DJT6_NOCSI|nr:hypothetical protein KR76_14535 [Pimelobacter simplex]GEB13681.1 hypothetical protein NSI01_19960 [Pimelobacter simplex]SFM70068.1 hypothetical protein SAMN05421671_2989 [Pimelobacter simplex]